MKSVRIAMQFISNSPRKFFNFVKREKLFYPLIITTFFLLNLFFIGHRVRFIILGEQLDVLNKKLSVASFHNQKLSNDVVNLMALPRIERFARDTCGMDRNNRIVVSWEIENHEEKNEFVNNAVYVIQRKAEDIILPEDAFVKGY